ncbi:MAG: ABC transporter permease subunit [Lachnospiraceae bacterium]|nr:ABC transporter permease subunit [Lachnospiraceae bacterium]
MKKTVIGLNLKYFLPAMAAALIGCISLFLPFVKTEGKWISLFSVCGRLGGSRADFLLYGAGICMFLSAVLALFSFVCTKKGSVITWQIVQVFGTIFMTLLIFSSKAILESSGVSTAFLNRQLGIGYWLGLIVSYVTLFLIMRITKTNAGYVPLTILSIIWLFPILWIVMTAFRAEQGYYVGYFIPHGFTIQNFIDLFSNPGVLPFGRWWTNSMIVALCGCCFNTMIILMTAFILSRTRFQGRRAFMNILMVIGMFPGFMSLVAVYNILKGLGLNQSLAALIIVGAAGAAMGYHVTKGFFDTIPKALDEAAIIDGANRFQIFTRITLPLSKSIIVYIMLGGFLGAWSDYIFPSMLFGDKQSSYTAAVGLFWMTDFRRIDTYYTQFAAGALVVAVPIVILFVWLQRFYVEGLSGSVKG